MIKMRIEKIQQGLENNEAVLISGGANRFYFTGFNSSAGTVLITKEASYFLIDFRYFEKANSVVEACEVSLSTNPLKEVKILLEKHKINRLYIETYSVSVNRFGQLEKALEGVKILNDDKIDKQIEQMRSIKSASELEAIKEAQKLTDDTFSYILQRIEAGRSEIDVMLDMEFYMRRLGSEGVSFDFIVVSGKNSSLPHGVPTDKKIENGDFVTMDFGAVINGYRSDMTRTVAVGSVSEEQRRVYETVLKAQTEAFKAIKPGVMCKDIDKVARDIIYSAGYEGCFGHGLGHSVGIEIHESPSFNPSCVTVTEPGMIITVEPGIYIENKFGVRIEDMAYITENGCISLTHSKKELIVL